MSDVVRWAVTAEVRKDGGLVAYHDYAMLLARAWHYASIMNRLLPASNEDDGA